MTIQRSGGDGSERSRVLRRPRVERRRGEDRRDEQLVPLRHRGRRAMGRPGRGRQGDGDRGHRHLAVLDLDDPLPGALDVEEVRVVHPGGLRLVDARLEAAEELANARCHLPRSFEWSFNNPVGRAYRVASRRAMDLDLTPEQELVRDTVRTFARERVAPVAAELDLEGRFPYELVEELAELGLMGLPIPEEHGGGGGGPRP